MIGMVSKLECKRVGILRWPIGMRKVVPMVSLICAMGLAGCASGSSSAKSIHTTESSLDKLAINPDRAYTPLEEIEPIAESPTRDQSVEPLSERAVRQVVRAQGFIAEQRYTEAALELERALRFEPNHPDIHAALATLHWQAGNVERARIHAARVLKINQDSAIANYVIGRCSWMESDPELAMASFRSALLCSDFGADVEVTALCHYYLAKVLASQEYLQAALTQYRSFEEKGSSLTPIPKRGELATLLNASRGSAAELKAEILEKLGRFREASEVLQPIVKQSPKDIALQLRYAQLLVRSNRNDEALAIVRNIRSSDEKVLNRILEIYESTGDSKAIIEELRGRYREQPNDAHLCKILTDALLRFGEAEEATETLKSYLQTTPTAELIRTRLIELYVQQGAWRQAIAQCAMRLERSPGRLQETNELLNQLATGEGVSEILQDSPASVSSHVFAYLYGALALRLNKDDLAQGFLGRSLDLAPTYAPSRVALARTLIRQYRYQEAIEITKRRDKDLAEDSDLETALGLAYERLDAADKAEQHFKAAIQLNRANTQAMLSLAELYRGTGRTLKAQRQLQAILVRNPADEVALEKLAVIYLSDDNIDAAVAQFRELDKVAKNPMVKARCDALLEHYPKVDAETYRNRLLEAIKKHKPDAATWIAIADSYNEATEGESRRDALEQAINVEPDNEDASLRLIETFKRLLEYEGATNELKRILPRRPNRHSWRLDLIRLFWIVQDYDAAEQIAKAHLKRDDLAKDVRTEFQLRLADSLRLNGKNDDALVLLHGWADQAKGDKLWQIRLANAHWLEDQAGKAAEILEKLYEVEPSDRSLLPAVIDALTNAEQFDRASQFILDWMSEDPESDDASRRLINVLIGSDRFDDALDFINHTLLQTTRREFFQTQAIRTLAEANRHEERLHYIDSLLDELTGLLKQVGGGEPRRRSVDESQRPLQPNQPFSVPAMHERLAFLNAQWAQVQFALQSFREAEDALGQWVHEARSAGIRVLYLRTLAQSYQMQGLDQKATTALKRALDLRPTDIGLNNDVAYGWINHGEKLDEAEKMIRFSLSRSPRQGAYLDTYGWLLYKKGEFAEAGKWLERAARSRGQDDPVVLDHLADAYWRMGKKDEALVKWERAAKAAQKSIDDTLQVVDMQRILEEAQEKISQAKIGNEPSVAPTAPTSKSPEGSIKIED